MAKKQPAGINITKEILSQEANDLIETYREEFNKRTKGTITRAAAVVKLLEKYSQSNIKFDKY